MRNQNIYTARLTGGLVAGSPGNAKPLEPDAAARVRRSSRRTPRRSTRTFRLTIVNQPAGGQCVVPAGAAASLRRLDPRARDDARRHGAAPLDDRAQRLRDVVEPGRADRHRGPRGDGCGGRRRGGGLQSTVILNPDISNPDISNPDISNPDISNPDISNPDISNAEVSNPDISNPDISNPDISNPDISNPDISNPDISNPDISNVQVANPDISNPDISNPDISNPDISNPDISNPDISNPDISNQSLTDTTWTVTNEGNTASSYSIKLLLNGAEPSPDQIALQLILRKVYTTPVAVNCELGLHAHNILLANITNPSFATTTAEVENPDISNPDISNATLWLAPGETAKVTLRVRDLDTTDSVTFDAVEAVTPGGRVAGPRRRAGERTARRLAAEPIAFPPTNSQNLRLQFGNLPVVVQPGGQVGLVTVGVTDPNNAPVPGATVYMSLHSDPGDAQVSPTVGTTSDANGTAAFNVGALPAGLYRVRFRVEAPGYPAVVGYSTITATAVQPPSVVQWTGGNGHFYEFVPAYALSWTQANAAAQARFHNGVPGHLATITSAGENAFITTLGGGQYRAWIGLSGPSLYRPVELPVGDRRAVLIRELGGGRAQ